MTTWTVTNKGDTRARELADRHYNRQTPGHVLWTRPGFNFVLIAEHEGRRALFNWWRPKWEDGVERKDGLRALECTIFRNETTAQSSDLITAAIGALDWPEARAQLRAGKSPPPTGSSPRSIRARRGAGDHADTCPATVLEWPASFPSSTGADERTPGLERTGSCPMTNSHEMNSSQ